MSEVERLNGHHDVLADLETCIRHGALLPPAQRCPGFHDFLDSANGVIHIGAHTGQERDIYGDLPVVWIEALPAAYKVLCEQIKDKPKQRALNCLIAGGKACRFGVSNNAGQSSSIYDFALHKELWPDVGHVASLLLVSWTLGQIIDLRGIDLDVFDTLVLDVQGAELLVLQGAGDYLDRFRWIQAEAADFEAYKGGCHLSDLDAYLTPRGFVREQTHCGREKAGVGAYYDVVYFNAKAEWSGEELVRRDANRFRRDGELVEAKLALAHAFKTTGITPEMQKAAWQQLEQENSSPLRLNLGAGRTNLPGFTPIDRKQGQEVYPLAFADGSVEEIVASHVLEHFSHRQVRAVLTDWVRVLKPGGKIRIAVPDADEVTRLYQAGAPVNIQGYLMGGHTDEDDYHRCLFDRESLTEEMMSVGLERIGPWDAPAAGCAAGPHSLNLMGFKPSGPATRAEGVRAVRSVPRYGPLMHPRCAERAFTQLGIPTGDTSSCYWAQQISNLMEKAIAHPDCRYVLTMDFDTVFCAADVMELYRLLEACPDVDAVIPFQAKRGNGDVLFSVAGKETGASRTAIGSVELTYNLLPANTGHFGLTLFRADSLRKFPRPWMVPQPNADGRWDKDHTDADIDFWRRFREAGFKACLAPRVVVGHLEEVVKWPGKDLSPVYQTGADYEANGIPADVAR